ncbi:MAG TPA: type II secretion system protein GspN [Vulgatibacter sp.]|nr:type II secretion system protein GspN [Vulgatibacter sp.]
MKLIEKIRGKRRWKWTGYSLFFSVVFYAALYLTFPYDALRDRVADVVRDRTGKQITIGEVRLAGFNGIRLHDVRLGGEESAAGAAARSAAARKADVEPGKELEGATEADRQRIDELAKRIESLEHDEGAADERRKMELELADLRAKLGESSMREAKGGGGDAASAPEQSGPPSGIQLDSLTARVDLLAALRGSQGLSFDARAWGGRIQGKVSFGEDSRRIAVHAKDLVLEQSPILALSGLDLEGTLESLDLELAAEGADFTTAAGRLVVKGDSLVLRGGEVQQFELPKVDLGILDGRVEVLDGRADTDGFEIRGPDLEAKVNATIRIAPDFGASTLTGKLQIKPSEDWWNRNEMLKTAANFAMPASGDGWRSLNLHGQLRRPGFRP